MSLTNIATLFSDILAEGVETTQQRQQRLLAEGQASAGQFTGLPAGIRELAMGISSNIPRNVEAVRRFGVQAGLPMQTQGEQLQGAMANFDIDDPNSRMAVLNQLRAIDPMRAVAFGEMLKEKDQAEAAAEAASVTRNLNQTLTGLEINEKLTDLAETEDQETTQESLRNTYVNQINNSTVLGEAEKNILINQVNAGAFDGKTDDIRSITSPKPLVVGGKAMIPTPNGWQEMAGMSDDDSLGVNKTTALKASAALQYGVDSENYKIIEQGIEANLITAANDFSKYVKPSEPEERLNIPSSVEEWNQEGLANQTAAEESDRRIDSVMNLILSEN